MFLYSSSHFFKIQGNVTSLGNEINKSLKKDLRKVDNAVKKQLILTKFAISVY